MTGGAGIRETWGRAAPGTRAAPAALVPQLPPEPLGEKEAECSPRNAARGGADTPRGGADTPTEKPLTLPPSLLAETSGLWTPTGYSGAFLIYFITHFTYM